MVGGGEQIEVQQVLRPELAMNARATLRILPRLFTYKGTKSVVGAKLSRTGASNCLLRTPEIASS